MGGGAGLTPGIPPQIKNLHLNFTFQSLEVKFENLMGGGSIEAVVETVINELGMNGDLLKYLYKTFVICFLH